MTAEEIEAVDSLIRNIAPSAILSSHAWLRCKEWMVTEDDIQKVFRYGSMVEVNIKGSSFRVVVRLDRKKKPAIIATLSISSGEVVTVWKNRLGDDHKTLNLSLYTSDFNVLEIISQLFKNRTCFSNEAMLH